MPKRLALPCRHPGCPHLVTTGFCKNHEPKREGQQAKDLKFYQSATWRRLRLLKLRNDPLCASCGRVASLVDHINPIATGGDKCDLNNLQSMCDRCHNIKRSRESRHRIYN